MNQNTNLASNKPAQQRDLDRPAQQGAKADLAADKFASGQQGANKDLARDRDAVATDKFASGQQAANKDLVRDRADLAADKFASGQQAANKDLVRDRDAVAADKFVSGQQAANKDLARDKADLARDRVDLAAQDKNQYADARARSDLKDAQFSGTQAQRDIAGQGTEGISKTQAYQGVQADVTGKTATTSKTAAQDKPLISHQAQGAQTGSLAKDQASKAQATDKTAASKRI